MKMPMKIDTKMFAPCGMNCIVCYKHCFTKKTRQPCGGCINDKVKENHCRKCKIKDCVQSKNLDYCYECNYFPCKEIKNLEKSYNQRYGESLIENSEFIKIYGLRQFMEMHLQKYQCSECGGLISLHDKVCTECGDNKKS